ncbi:MAG: FkbM family methyltransferase [Gemmatimonadaceae bacterium]|nr:FkbM family methyltransferase [Gemmatimonadaceae bacterium]
MISAAWVYDAGASALRALPDFRGKWQLVGVLHRGLLPLVRHDERVRLVTMKDGSRMTWDVSDASEAHAYWLGCYDDALSKAVIRLLPRHAVVLDVGANVGAWTVPLARAARELDGRVVAFEPVPSNRSRLEDTVARNDLGNVVRIEAVALGDKAGEVGMWLRSSVTGASTGTAAVTEEGGHLRVQMVTLDAWMERAGIPHVDFMKLDIEGAELLLLRGASDTIGRHRPLILAEFDAYWMSTFGLTRAQAEAWASENAYEFLRWDGRQGRFAHSPDVGAEAFLLVPRERQAQSSSS